MSRGIRKSNHRLVDVVAYAPKPQPGVREERRGGQMTCDAVSRRKRTAIAVLALTSIAVLCLALAKCTHDRGERITAEGASFSRQLLTALLKTWNVEEYRRSAHPQNYDLLDSPERLEERWTEYGKLGAFRGGKMNVSSSPSWSWIVKNHIQVDLDGLFDNGEAVVHVDMMYDAGQWRVYSFTLMARR